MDQLLLLGCRGSCRVVLQGSAFLEAALDNLLAIPKQDVSPCLLLTC